MPRAPKGTHAGEGSLASEKVSLPTLSRLAARRSDTTRPPDEAAGCCHCLYDVDSVGAVEWSKPGAATAYMTVKVKNGEEEKKKKNKCFGGGQLQS